MKKLIYGGLFLVLIGIFVYSCQKENVINPRSNRQFIEGNNTTSVLNMSPAYSKSYVIEIVNSAYDFSNIEKSGGDKWRRFWRKVGKWFKDHSGTHLFKNCHGTGSCGPCPGLCLSGMSDAGNNDSDSVSEAEYEQGLRAFGIDILVDSTGKEYTMFKFYKDVDAFVKDEFFYIQKDVSINQEMAESLSVNGINLKKGKYYVVFDESTGYYYALVKSEIKN